MAVVVEVVVVVVVVCVETVDEDRSRSRFHVRLKKLTRRRVVLASVLALALVAESGDSR